MVTNYDVKRNVWLGFTTLISDSDHIIGDVPTIFKVKKQIPLERLLGKTVSLSDDYTSARVDDHLVITADHFVFLEDDDFVS